MNDLCNKNTRSRRAFTEALVELSKCKSVEDISISELARCAGYSRNAFYAQFESFEAFLYAVVDAEVLSFKQALQQGIERFHQVITECTNQGFLVMFEHFYARREFYKFIFSTHSPVDLAAIFNRKIVDVFVNCGIFAFPDTPEDYENTFYLCLGYGKYWAAIRFWIDQGFVWSPVKMAEEFTRYSNIDMQKVKFEKKKNR